MRDVASDLIGTSMCWVEVPDLQKSKLSLSSLFLGREGKSQDRPETPAGQDKQSAAPTFIIGRASFKSGDIAYYRFVVYSAQGSGEAESPATIKVEILEGETVVYPGAWQPLSARTIRRDANGIEAGGRLQLGLGQGVYSLRITIKYPKSKKSVQQTADFEIEP